jgi:hypothetical protein
MVPKRNSNLISIGSKTDPRKSCLAIHKFAPPQKKTFVPYMVLPNRSRPSRLPLNTVGKSDQDSDQIVDLFLENIWPILMSKMAQDEPT